MPGRRPRSTGIPYPLWIWKRLTTKTLRKKTKQTLRFHCMVPAQPTRMVAGGRAQRLPPVNFPKNRAPRRGGRNRTDPSCTQSLCLELSTNKTPSRRVRRQGGRSAGWQPALDGRIGKTVGNTGPWTTKVRFTPVTDRRYSRNLRCCCGGNCDRALRTIARVCPVVTLPPRRARPARNGGALFRRLPAETTRLGYHCYLLRKLL